MTRTTSYGFCFTFHAQIRIWENFRLCNAFEFVDFSFKKKPTWNLIRLFHIFLIGQVPLNFLAKFLFQHLGGSARVCFRDKMAKVRPEAKQITVAIVCHRLYSYSAFGNTKLLFDVP